MKITDVTKKSLLLKLSESPGSTGNIESLAKEELTKQAILREQYNDLSDYVIKTHLQGIINESPPEGHPSGCLVISVMELGSQDLDYYLRGMIQKNRRPVRDAVFGIAYWLLICVTKCHKSGACGLDVCLQNVVLVNEDSEVEKLLNQRHKCPLRLIDICAGIHTHTGYRLPEPLQEQLKKDLGSDEDVSDLQKINDLWSAGIIIIGVFYLAAAGEMTNPIDTFNAVLETEFGPIMQIESAQPGYYQYALNAYLKELKERMNVDFFHRTVDLFIACVPEGGRPIVIRKTREKAQTAANDLIEFINNAAH